MILNRITVFLFVFTAIIRQFWSMATDWRHPGHPRQAGAKIICHSLSEFLFQIFIFLFFIFRGYDIIGLLKKNFRNCSFGWFGNSIKEIFR